VDVFFVWFWTFAKHEQGYETDIFSDYM
jgi:hypothetical protein